MRKGALIEDVNKLLGITTGGSIGFQATLRGGGTGHVNQTLGVWHEAQWQLYVVCTNHLRPSWQLESQKEEGWAQGWVCDKVRVNSPCWYCFFFFLSETRAHVTQALVPTVGLGCSDWSSSAQVH